MWSGTEQQRFGAVIRDFESETGVVVRYVPAGHDISAVLAERRAAHRLPDVAFIPQPGLLREYVRDGVVLPLAPSAVGEVTRNYPSVWRELGTVDGRLYAVWFKAANKSLVWYDLSAFEKAGVIPPGDLNGLVTLSRTFATRGVPAFSLGARDGWTLTDWFENVYLALAGPRRYDDLATHRIPWTDPTVKQALRLLAELWTPRNVAGGVRGALATTFERSVQRAFGPPHAAAMVIEGDFVESAITGSDERTPRRRRRRVPVSRANCGRSLRRRRR